MPPGRVKVKHGGSSSGHRGVDSCEAALRGGAFWRVRLGIGRPADRADVPDFVLESVTASEAAAMNLARVAAALPTLLVAEGVTQASSSCFMNLLSRPAPAQESSQDARRRKVSHKEPAKDGPATEQLGAAPSSAKRSAVNDAGCGADMAADEADAAMNPQTPKRMKSDG